MRGRELPHEEARGIEEAQRERRAAEAKAAARSFPRLRINVTSVSPGYITCSLFQSDNAGTNWGCVDAVEWTLQGLGMLRCYLEPELRLHVWDSRYKAPGASELHTHPWDFNSLVVAGSVLNYRFVESDGTSQETGGAIPRLRQTIRCGEGGGLVGEPEQVFLTELPTERLDEGMTYTQKAEEIHASRPEDGTVTVIERSFKADTEHAYVYFEGEWGTAEPRPATDAEVHEIVTFALAEHF